MRWYSELVSPRAEGMPNECGGETGSPCSDEVSSVCNYDE